MYVTSIGTYLPVWGRPDRRASGEDEDAVTLAVAAGRCARAGTEQGIDRVVLVTRDFPLLIGGNGAALLAGLDLHDDVEVVERLGGAPATLDALVSSPPGTMVIAAEPGEGAGAAAAVVSTSGLRIEPVRRVNRSLPVLARDARGVSHEYGDPRLLRHRGASRVLQEMQPPPAAIAGLSNGEAKATASGSQPTLPTTGAASILFCLAALADGGRAVVAAVDQGNLTAVSVVTGDRVAVVRDERPARKAVARTHTPGLPIPIALPAYDRAFDAKLRWRAGRDAQTGALDLPPRAVTDERQDDGDLLLVELPRRGRVYSHTTIRVPVPGKSSPYQLAIVELDGTAVRATVATTDAASPVDIGTVGDLVLRLVAVRSGVPDYGYAFRPDDHAQEDAR